MDFGQKLKEARTIAGLKQEELAQKIGVSRQTVSNWENNRSYPDIASMMKLSDLYGLSLDEMLKEDRKVQEHYENRSERKRRFWKLALEYALVAEALGILLTGQNFSKIGFVLQLAGIIGVWISLWMHIRLFDHTREEIRLFVVGFCLIIGGNLLQLLFPNFFSGTSLAKVIVTLISAAGPWLIFYSNVWSQFWKSPRFLLILLLIVGVPLFNFTTGLQSAGTLNTDSPFPQDYRIAEVLYPEDTAADPAVRIDLHNFLDENTLRIYKNGDEYSRIGSFVYQEPSATQTEKGIWLLTPEGNPRAQYRVTAEQDGSVTLSYSEGEQLQWKWLLREEYSCQVTVATFGHTMTTMPNWLLPEEEDPEPYFIHTDVNGTAKMTISLGLPEGEKLTLIEEYHHGGSMECTEYALETEKIGSFQLNLKTRYDGEEEFALYRIPYKGGEFRFILTFDVGAGEAFRALIGKE